MKRRQFLSRTLLTGAAATAGVATCPAWPARAAAPKEFAESQEMAPMRREMRNR